MIPNNCENQDDNRGWGAIHPKFVPKMPLALFAR